MNCRFGVYRRSRRRPTPPAGRSRPRCLTFGFLFAGLAAALLATAAEAAQDQLAINTATDGPVLRFDWSAVQIGIGSYEEGPTGLTIFRFPQRVTAVVDVRGGAPGTVNTDILRLGYDERFVDAVVLAGGSTYGLEATTAVMSGLMDDGSHSGAWDQVATAAGAIIYDLRDHRVNEIYPDKRLALAALHSLRAGVFPQGAQGAGRAAVQGGLFGCNAHSGQGGAFRQIGQTKIAAFVVVNALGVVTDRDGRLVRCHRDPAWGDIVKTSDLLAHVAAHAQPSPDRPSQHTNISLVVTNRRMSVATLQRLAVQVHTSMGRGIQPIATAEDGDTLFAVSTQELPEDASLPLDELYIAASETMWDAILASVPDEPEFHPSPSVAISAEQMGALAGDYRFGRNALLHVWVQDGALLARLIGQQFLELGPQPTVLHPISAQDFYVESRFHTRVSFTPANGRANAAMINPGRWVQHGERVTQ
jgi:L-aminopeptidase/D-esterase-like protein